MKTLDRSFGCLMILGGVGHAFGSFAAYKYQPLTLLWALSTSFAGWLLAALNLLRTWRLDDRPLAWISLAGCLIWLGFVLAFGVLIGNIFDVRALVNLIITLGLAVFSVRSVLQSRRGEP